MNTLSLCDEELLGLNPGHPYLGKLIRENCQWLIQPSLAVCGKICIPRPAASYGYRSVVAEAFLRCYRLICIAFRVRFCLCADKELRLQYSDEKMLCLFCVPADP
jgi:hypothetical protein